MVSRTLWWTFHCGMITLAPLLLLFPVSSLLLDVWILNYFVIQRKVMMNLLVIIIPLLLIFIKNMLLKCLIFKSSTDWKSLWKLHHMRRYKMKNLVQLKPSSSELSVSNSTMLSFMLGKVNLYWSSCSFNYQFRFFHFFYMLVFVIQLANHFRTIFYFFIPSSFIVNRPWFSSHAFFQYTLFSSFTPFSISFIYLSWLQAQWCDFSLSSSYYLLLL